MPHRTAQASMMATEADVRAAYRLLFGREADPGGWTHHAALVGEGIVTTTDLADMFFRSAEFRSAVGRVVIPTGSAPPDSPPPLACQPCTKRQIETPNFRYWAARLGLRPGGLHRKAWEWCYIVQALYERGMLRPGRKGLGFAVGQEPLTSLFVGMGCEVTATDLDFQHALDEGWVDGKQHAANLEQLNTHGLCAPELFAANARFRVADMRDIPSELDGFDFLWSSCALEHLGSLRHGMDFVLNAMACLRPGGIAVHTTELNVDSDSTTLETGHDVIYRQRDLRELDAELRRAGHHVEPLTFDVGDSDADRYVDDPPYTGKIHLKLRIGGFASTSFGIIVSKNHGRGSPGC
ncbi:methyltransferase domain-containing protein [Dokdonella fugitiva]|uniref:methyltransferase domain-containing protein n=1 Tax=Dokdonella fugitiva TaxID=328517 RepID=UPI0015FC8BFB|nr:methyltransferase domain-containing protein [Dokdonella fugitiva]MBA8882435.1 hypothetical protein [Dokdonella fugitiva]